MGLFGGLSDFVGPAAMAAGYAMGGPAGGALMAGGLGYMGRQETNQANAANVEAANQFSAQQYATRYQTQVKDLEAAGLNPMLAYSQGPGSAPTGQAARFDSPVSDAVSAYQSYRGTEASSTRDYASAAQAEANVKQIEATTDKVRADIEKLKGDTNFATQQDILKQTAWSLQQAGSVNQERGISEGQRRAVMQATINNLQKDGTLKQLDIDAAKKFENWGREYQQLKPVVDLLVNLLTKGR